MGNKEQDVKMQAMQVEYKAMQVEYKEQDVRMRTIQERMSRLERILVRKNLEDSTSAEDDPAGGLNSSEIDNLRSEVLKKDLGDLCSICHENLKTGEEVHILGCDHIFHKTKSCGIIQPWLTRHRTCPICRADAVTGKNLVQASAVVVTAPQPEPHQQSEASGTKQTAK